MPGLYSEGMVVLIQGEMKGGVFEANVLAQPKAEPREKFLSTFPSFKISSKYDDNIPQSANVVILSDVWLDKNNVLKKIKKLFEGYCSNRFLPELFVLIGNFNSVPLDSLGTNSNSYKEGFDNLSKIMMEFPLLQENSQFIFVPGPNDPFSSGILPRKSIAPHFISSSFEKFDNITFTSNPCKITFYSKEIFIFRHDMLSTMQRCSVVDNSYEMEDLYDVYVQSILGQSHLSPVPLNVNPVYWKYDYTLGLDILPDLVSFVIDFFT